MAIMDRFGPCSSCFYVCDHVLSSHGGSHYLSSWIEEGMTSIVIHTCVVSDEGQSPTKPDGNDSDSDSDASMDRNSLDLASSHSSDEDDDFEIGPPWDQHIPKSKAVGKCEASLLDDRLVGLVVKASASRVEDLGFKSRLRRDFSRVESYQ